MKKSIFILFLLSSMSGSYAQNYQCLQSGVKHYFNNSIGYLRGIRIDSVKTTGDTVVYYPFHTSRGTYSSSSFSNLDTTGGSWLGKHVLQLSNGTFIFDDNWNDSVIIKTQANLGDSWVFYQDSGDVYYKASVISIDTLTMAGIFDTVKSIQINAYIGSAVYTSDSVNGMQIILSKNHGFYQVPDLYTFPYHLPDSSFTPGLDFYLDKSTVLPNELLGYIGYPPSFNLTIFKLCVLYNPSYQQLFDFHTGDVYEYETWLNLLSAGGWVPPFFERDSVTDKLLLGTQTEYRFVDTASYPNPFRLYYFADSGFHAISLNNTLLIDTSLMPEEYGQQHTYYYLPDDSSFCMHSPGYQIAPSYMYSLYPPFYLGDLESEIAYKVNLGQVYYHQDFYGGDVHQARDSLVYNKNGAAACGTDHAANVTNSAAKKGALVYPNPAANILTIETASMQLHTIALWNTLGQQILNLHSTREKETINTANLSSGLYYISITDNEGNRYNDKVVIVH